MRCDLCNKEITDGKWVEYEEYAGDYYDYRMRMAHNDCYTKHLAQSHVSKPYCHHKWSKYTGFTDTYYYCEWCSEKIYGLNT